MALAHVSMCPRGVAWLEGVRVRSDFRRTRVATALLERMLGWAASQGVRAAAAIVSEENVPSQRLMEENNFSVISTWAYYSVSKRSKKSPTRARLAVKQEIAEAWAYLKKSRMYRLSAGRYVSSWQWYILDRKALKDLVMAGRVVVTGRPVNGLAVLNKTGYWDRPNVMQIVYLDPGSPKSLQDLLAFAANLHIEGYCALHVLCHNSKRITSAIEKFRIEESEVFLLYSKKVFT